MVQQIITPSQLLQSPIPHSDLPDFMMVGYSLTLGLTAIASCCGMLIGVTLSTDMKSACTVWMLCVCLGQPQASDQMS